MITGGRQEQKVQKLIIEHLDKVETCLNKLWQSFENYLNNKLDEAEDLSYEVHTYESRADHIRRAIIQELHEGAFLPIYRGGLMSLVAMIDKIADHAESSTDFLISQHPEIPDEYKEDIKKLIKDSISCFKPFKEGVIALFNDFSKLRKKVKEVNQLESDVDKDEWKTNRKIFDSKLELSHKIHLRSLIWHIAKISDDCQDAADALETITVHKAF